MERAPVDLVRVAVDSDAEEETEERHVASVFPTEGRNFASGDAEELKASVGSRFISETQLNAAHESGLATRDAHGQAGRSLAVVLAENKQKKEEAFQEQWRTMKQGKNRPLDPDEFEFVDALYKEEANRMKAQFDHAQKDADEFKKAREELSAQKLPQKKASPRAQRPKKKTGLSVRPRLKVVPKKRQSTVSATDRTHALAKKSADAPEVKRVKD